MVDKTVPEYDLVRIHYNEANKEDDPNYCPWIIRHGETTYRVKMWDIHGKAWGVFDPNPNEATHAWMECRGIVVVKDGRALIITESAKIKEK